MMNLDEFAKSTNKKGSDLTKELKKQLIKSKFNLEKFAKQNATKDFYGPTTRSGHVRDYPLTGRLRSSIKGRLIHNQNTVSLILQAGGHAGGANVEYAGILEFGGLANFNGTRRRIKPYFFLARAVQKEEKQLLPFLQKFLELRLEDLK
tara:strand:+ start:162 stop:608 length:447 start_codon:yes stop_codon:yes gene_type:complete